MYSSRCSNISENIAFVKLCYPLKSVLKTKVNCFQKAKTANKKYRHAVPFLY